MPRLCVLYLASLSLMPKQDLDAALKAVCEDLIAKAGVLIAAPVLNFTSRARTYLQLPNASDLPAQDFATPDQVRNLHSTFVEPEGGLESGFNDLLAKLNLWLGDKKTISVLVTPILVRHSSRCSFLKLTCLYRRKCRKPIRSFTD
jgi:hypothetical protein